MKNKRVILYLIMSISLLFLWEYYAKQSNTVRLFISSPSLVGKYISDNYSTLLMATWTTFYEAVAGLVIATLFSFLTMIICFYHSKLMEYFLPIMIISQVIPLITLAPLFIILFGTGATAKILMASLLCYFPIFVNFANGVKLISKNIHELLFVYNATTTQKIRHVYFPLALPNIMTGLKVAATLAVIGAIVAEFAGAETGLGRNLFIAALRTEPDLMMSSLFLSSILGGLMFASIHIIESKIGKWYVQNNN
jgi:NitT/TauT family transport system permease protein